MYRVSASMSFANAICHVLSLLGLFIHVHVFVLCFEAVNLGNACTSDDECVAGDGGAGTKCSTNCVTREYFLFDI